MAVSRRSGERYEFIDRMIEQVLAIPIDKVMGRYLKLEPRGRHLMALCPFHKDTHLGSFVVTPGKGIWKCFACGDEYAGSSIKFVSLYTGLPYLDAAFQVAIDNGVISHEEYDKYSKKQYNEEAVRKIENRYTAKAQEEKPVRAPLHICQKAWQILKDQCPVSEERCQQLMKERHLSRKRIDRDYLEMPRGAKKNAVMKAIHEAGISDEELMFVPGFYLDVEKNQTTFVSYVGIGILIRDCYGNIQAVQVRKDSVKEGDSRYIWMSSAFAFDDKNGKYSGGCGCGSPKDVLWPSREKLKEHVICITEGRFKSEVLADIGWPTVSVQGVQAWHGIENAIRDIAKQKCLNGLKQIRLMFDADIFGKRALFEQTEKLCEMLGQKFHGVDVVYYFWDMSVGKGIDDYLFNGGPMADIKGFRADKAREIADKTFEAVLREFHVDKLKDVPQKDAEKLQKLLQARMEVAFDIKKGGKGESAE